MRKKEIVRERPLEYMRRRRDGMPYPSEVVRHWYVARAYVLDRLKEVVIGPDSREHLEVVVDGDSPLMLACRPISSILRNTISGAGSPAGTGRKSRW